VSDESLWRARRFASDAGLGATVSPAIAQFCERFEAGPPLTSSPDAVRWKGLIRRNEAIAAARACGVTPDCVHFLDLPFYQAPAGRRRHLSEADISRPFSRSMGEPEATPAA